MESIRALLGAGADPLASDNVRRRLAAACGSPVGRQKWRALGSAFVPSCYYEQWAGADEFVSGIPSSLTDCSQFRRTAVDACTDDVCRDLMANPESAQRWLRRQQLVIWQASN